MKMERKLNTKLAHILLLLCFFLLTQVLVHMIPAEL